jgi:hypothetical protein
MGIRVDSTVGSKIKQKSAQVLSHKYVIFTESHTSIVRPSGRTFHRIRVLRKKSANERLLVFIFDAAKKPGAKLSYGLGIIEGKLRIHLATLEMTGLAP